MTGLTAARTHRLWLPPLPDDLPVFAVTAPQHSRTVRAGCRLRREKVMPAHTLKNGVPVVTPAEALLACARDVSLLDLVVLTDSALALDLTTPAELADLAATSRQGAPALRAALGWADVSESAWETLLRVLHRCAGVEVEPQYDVFDYQGRFVARGDLRLQQTRMLHEYDGGDHRTPRGQRRDLERDRRLIEAGWQRRGFVAYDISARPADIIREARTSLGLACDHRGLERWLAMWDASMFSPLGAFRARERWNLA